MTAADYRVGEEFLLLKGGKTIQTVTGEVLGTGDGATSLYTGNLVGPGAISPGSISITDGTETFTDANGVLTGSAGGTGTINYETRAYSVTFNANVTNLQDITAAYSHLEVFGADLLHVENIVCKYMAQPRPQNISTGGLSGALPAPGTEVMELSGQLPLYASEGWEAVSNEEVGEGDGAETTFAFTLAKPFIHNSALYTTPAGGAALSITDGTETFTSSGAGSLTGSAGGSGTVNYETGAVTLTFNAAPTNGQPITANYSYMAAPAGHDLLTMSHDTVWTETNAGGTIRYYLSRCGQTEAGARHIRKTTDCTSGTELRGDSIRVMSGIKGAQQDRLMLEFSGFGAPGGPPADIPALPTLGLLPEDAALTHARATTTFVAKTAAGDVTYGGEVVGDFEVIGPFSPEQILTARGTRDIAEVSLVAARDAKTQFKCAVGLPRPQAFDLARYQRDLTLHEISVAWASRVFPGRTVTFRAVGYIDEMDLGEQQDVVLADTTWTLVHGVPGGTVAEYGRDTSQPLGVWDWYAPKPT